MREDIHPNEEAERTSTQYREDINHEEVHHRRNRSPYRNRLARLDRRCRLALEASPSRLEAPPLGRRRRCPALPRLLLRQARQALRRLGQRLHQEGSHLRLRRPDPEPGRPILPCSGRPFRNQTKIELQADPASSVIAPQGQFTTAPGSVCLAFRTPSEDTETCGVM